MNVLYSIDICGVNIIKKLWYNEKMVQVREKGSVKWKIFILRFWKCRCVQYIKIEVCMFWKVCFVCHVRCISNM
jgi:hypothetical protein